jgi:hypothetical protein
LFGENWEPDPVGPQPDIQKQRDEWPALGHSGHWTGVDANQLAMTASGKTEASLPTRKPPVEIFGSGRSNLR